MRQFNESARVLSNAEKRTNANVNGGEVGCIAHVAKAKKG